MVLTGFICRGMDCENSNARAVQDVMGPFHLQWLAGGWLCECRCGERAATIRTRPFFLYALWKPNIWRTSNSSVLSSFYPLPSVLVWWWMIFGLQWTAFVLCFYLWVVLCEYVPRPVRHYHTCWQKGWGCVHEALRIRVGWDCRFWWYSAHSL